jgi:hypothetical protein
MIRSTLLTLALSLAVTSLVACAGETTPEQEDGFVNDNGKPAERGTDERQQDDGKDLEESVFAPDKSYTHPARCYGPRC